MNTTSGPCDAGWYCTGSSAAAAPIAAGNDSLSKCSCPDANYTGGQCWPGMSQKQQIESLRHSITFTTFETVAYSEIWGGREISIKNDLGIQSMLRITFLFFVRCD